DRRRAESAGRHDQEPAVARLQAVADSPDRRSGGRVMNPPTCMEVMEQIDLYAAGECDAAEARRLAAHIAACPSCAPRLRKATALQGVLTLRFRERENLLALHERLPRETKPRPV